MKRALALLALGALSLAAEEPPRAVPLLDREAVAPDEEIAPEPAGGDAGDAPSGSSISSSGQFRVRGGSAAQRGSLATEAERVRSRFHRLLNQDGEEVGLPMEIVLHGEAGDPPRERALAYELRFTRSNFLLRVHVDLARGIDLARMERAVIRGLLYEAGLEGVEPGPLDAPLEVPEWLVEGLREAMRWRAGEAERRLYRGVFEQESLFTMDELLETGPADYARMDGASRLAFQVLSGALAMALLDQPGGVRGMVAFCGEVARFDGEQPILLRRHFPELNLSEKSLAKWWALTLAQLAETPVSEVMTVAATERALEEALRLRHRDGEGMAASLPLERWRELESLGERERLEAVRPAQDALNRLSFRCFPSYRPLLLDYQRLLVAWVREDELDVFDAELSLLAETRQRMMERSVRARDYLDYLEIAGANELSGSFDDYLRLKKELRERSRAEREDELSRYLDTLERVYTAPALEP